MKKFIDASDALDAEISSDDDEASYGRKKLKKGLYNFTHYELATEASFLVLSYM